MKWKVKAPITLRWCVMYASFCKWRIIDWRNNNGNSLFALILINLFWAAPFKSRSSKYYDMLHVGINHATHIAYSYENLSFLNIIILSPPSTNEFGFNACLSISYWIWDSMTHISVILKNIKKLSHKIWNVGYAIKKKNIGSTLPYNIVLLTLRFPFYNLYNF